MYKNPSEIIEVGEMRDKYHKERQKETRDSRSIMTYDDTSISK